MTREMVIHARYLRLSISFILKIAFSVLPVNSKIRLFRPDVGLTKKTLWIIASNSSRIKNKKKISPSKVKEP